MQDDRNRPEPGAIGRPTRAFCRCLGLWIGGGLIGLWLGGCGAGMDGQSAQEPVGEPETVAQSTARFDQAERDLQDSLIATGQGRHEHDDEGVDSPGQPGMVPPSAPPPPGVGRAHQAQAGQSRCDRACRALASMQRSADRLCSLAGESDQRCDNVRHRVRAARHLVRQLCSDCSA
jgi:hypothetical protein